MIYLEIAYAQKDEAKPFGARWDPKEMRTGVVILLKFTRLTGHFIRVFAKSFSIIFSSDGVITQPRRGL
jgi:hypothetical protein